jgi:hypothetical protein
MGRNIIKMTDTRGSRLEGAGIEVVVVAAASTAEDGAGEEEGEDVSLEEGVAGAAGDGTAERLLMLPPKKAVTRGVT